MPNLFYTAQAAATMNVSPTSGIVGTPVTVSMSRLTAGTTYYLYMQDSYGNQVGGNPIATFTSSSTGSTISDSNKKVENEVMPAETTKSYTMEQTNKNEENSKPSVDNVEASNLAKIKGKKKGKNESKNDNEASKGEKHETNITQKEGGKQ